jgi:hypothetical protein
MLSHRKLPTMFKNLTALTLIAAVAMLLAASCSLAQEYRSGIKWPEPPIVTPGKSNADPPSDAIILFDGKDLSAWKNGDKWIVKDGVAIVNGTEITTKQSFGDCQLHVEWSAPVPATGKGQGRGNSGVFFMDRYELQVLDSYDNKTYFDGQASAIYKQTPPMVNAMRPPGEWNTYDAIWTAPKFKSDGELELPAYITVLHNGVLTLNHFAVEGVTDFPEYPHYEMHGKAPIHLQNHGNPVRFRNIWLREIKPLVGVREREPYFHDHKTNTDTPVDRSAPVKGKITVDGKPLQKAKISYHSNKGDEVLSADVRDGQYEIKNLKPGVYVVSIQTRGDGAKLPERYNVKSEFTRNIRPGRNEIDYDLKSN